MPDETLISAAEPDRFTTESPVRAFTDFRVAGTWAIGKGFRPSLAHLHTYLDAMQNKEGWHLVQMLEGGTANPTLIFQRDRDAAWAARVGGYTVEGPKPPITMEDVDAHFREMGFALVATPEGNLQYVPERKIGKHPALAAPYTASEDRTPAWMQHGSDDEIPREHRLAAAEYVIGRTLNASNSGEAVESVTREFKRRFMSTKTTQVSHTTLASQLEFVLGANAVRIKQLIDAFREEHRLRFREPYKDFAKSVLDTPEGQAAVTNAALSVYIKTPNVGDDPINPAYYDGTACAEIIEHMPTNVGIAAKYVWRLGEKDAERQECGKAGWYLKRELALYDDTVVIGNGRATFGFANPADSQWYRGYADRRIDAARKAGKLTPERALCLTHLVSYTITGQASLLHQAIGFLESPYCFNEYGRGQQP